MRAAPPVSVRCSGGRWWRGLQTALPTLAAAASGAWALQLAERPPAWAAVFALAVAALSWRLAAPKPVDLVWDGLCWTADGLPGQLDVMLNGGGALLLRLRPGAGDHSSHRFALRNWNRNRWIAVTAAEVGPAMHGLRVAAYHRVVAPPERAAAAASADR